jgi:hypothetical protein
MNDEADKRRRLGEAAEIARLIWNAAQPLKPSLLDDGRAEELGSALKKAAHWYRLAAQKRPPRERERLKRIRDTAKKLSKLLAEDPETLLRIELEIPRSFDEKKLSELLAENERTQLLVELEIPHSLDRDIVKGVDIIKDAADRALFARDESGEIVQRRRGSAILEERFGSPARLFVCLLAAAYEKATGAKAGVTFNVVTQKIEGPFVRFVSESAGQLSIPLPDEETIKRSTSARR